MLKNPWVIVGGIAVVLFGGAIVFSGGTNSPAVSNEGVVVTDHVAGNPNAAVTLTEFSDLQCPACASFQPIIASLLESYGDQFRFEYKHFPLPAHTFALRAALAAEAAGQQGKFFEFHDMVFERQQEWSSSRNPSDLFVAYAEELGLDTALFSQHQRSTLLRDKIFADQAEGDNLQITGTPTFFLNGQKIEFTSYQEFLTQITTAIDLPLETATPESTETPAPAATEAVPTPTFGF